MKHVYVGILAGGSGERLWPLSSVERPKQFIPFLNNYSLLEKTVQRVATIPGVITQNIFVVTGVDQAPLVEAVVGEQIGFMVQEPVGRNTAPALLLACEQVAARDSNAVIIFVPADHFIPDEAAFAVCIEQALAEAQQADEIVLLGLKPLYPATGYGYIEVAHNAPATGTLPIKRFHEKPDRERAELYCQRSTMYWNLGIFIAQVAVFKQELLEHAPDLCVRMDDYLAGICDYAQLPSISIDYAVMEKSLKTVLIEAHFAWYDVGTVRTFVELRQQYAGVANPVITVKGGNNVADTLKKRVVCVGVSDVCIIETADSILVVHKDALEEVKTAALLIRQQGAGIKNKQAV